MDLLLLTETHAGDNVPDCSFADLDKFSVFRKHMIAGIAISKS